MDETEVVSGLLPARRPPPVQRQRADARSPTATADEEAHVEVGGSRPVLWFRHDSTELRQDARADSTIHLTLTAARIREHLVETGAAGRVVLHGYASSEGNPAHNMGLSQARAERVKALLVQMSIPAERIATVPHGSDRSMPGRAWNRRVEVELQPQVTRISFPAEEVTARPRRPIAPGERGVLNRLAALAAAARTEGTAGRVFADEVEDFRTTLRTRLDAVRAGDPLPDDVAMVMRALMLWSADPGNRWGEGVWDSTDVTMTAADYATVPASQYKCTAYVAEIIYQAVGVVQRAYASAEEQGRYFPYRARDWGDPAIAIPHFPVVTMPVMGDVWSSGPHVGIYLGEYAGTRLYVSARDDAAGVFGAGAIQHAHGVQIKAMPSGGLFRRYTP